MFAGGGICTGPGNFARGWLAEGPTSMAQPGNGRCRARLDCGLRQELPPEEGASGGGKEERTINERRHFNALYKSSRQPPADFFVAVAPVDVGIVGVINAKFSKP
ncbi:hypothetical protein B0H11DRAFT_1918288 [Mycena galericulata]|nr:hypothetical protein B0H11DRAFT_1918288 [Mycena galericulata]